MFTRAFAGHLYVRIWLAALMGVVLITLAAGWLWRAAEDERNQPLPRDVVLRDAQGRSLGEGTSQRVSRPGEPLEFAINLNDGRQFSMEMGPMPGRKPGADAPPWVRPGAGLFWLLGLVGLATALGLYPVVRRLTKRLEAVQRGMQRWGAGDLSARVSEDGQDEVADLAKHFNTAATRVEQLVRSQKSLLANASHELRSPLTRIRMGVELLQASTPSPSFRAEVLRNINELDQLVDEILLASRLDAQQTDLGTDELVDMTGLLAEECARVGANLNVAEGAASIDVRGVSKLLRRAVRNLLENARRYSTGDITAEVQTDAARRTVVVTVRDHGPGVPPDLRERIFEPFYRLPGASEREGGVGLGLALVRSIAARHGGHIQCTERPDGLAGANFVLTLPMPTIGTAKQTEATSDQSRV